MAKLEKLAIAYCVEDADWALQLQEELAEVADFQFFSAGADNTGPVLSELCKPYQGWLLLLISDAFLQNANCMLYATRLLNHGGYPTLAVLVDTRQVDTTLGETSLVPLELNKQRDIMEYINRWQARYLDLRRQSKNISEEAGPDFDRYLLKIREVSGQINDFLQQLLDSAPLHWEELRYNHFENFFSYIEQEEQHAAFITNRSQANKPTPAIDDDELEETSSATTLKQQADQAHADQAHADQAQADQGMVSEESIADLLDEQLLDEQLLDEEDESAYAGSASEEVLRCIERAWAQADAGQVGLAIDLLRSGREALPEQTELHYHHALLLATAANDPASAREELEELLAQYPDHPDALFLSGELYYSEGRSHLAREAWESLADQQPDYPELNAHLGLLIAEHFEEDALVAAALLKKAIEEQPEKTDLRYQYALLLAGSLAKNEKAISVLQQLIARTPDHAGAQYALACLLHSKADYPAAQQAYERAKTLEPDLATEQNDAAFQTPTPSLPQFMPDTTTHTLSALKENIAQLEALLQAQEAKAAAEAQAKATEISQGAGKTVLISGATSGIGLAMAHRFAKAGFRLILTGRRAERLALLQSELQQQYETAILALTFDIRHAADVAAAIENLAPEWQNIDILINNAGKAKGFDPIHSGQIAHWDEMIDTNLKGLLYLTRAITPSMVAKKDGLIINICSTAGKEVYANGNVYCATKHAVDALTHAMRLDLVQHGIRVGQICPAHVEETEFAIVRFDGDTERAGKVYENFQPLRASDVAEAVFFMATQAAHVNILDLVIQGKQQASSNLIDRSGR